jgi:protein-S-isoprenylcysteine O-methyltransferase Ste14
MAGAYFSLQGAAVALWWLLLVFFPSTRVYFQIDANSESALLAFWLPDLLLLALGSLVAGVLCFGGSSLATAAVWFTSGAVCYASLYCLSLAILTGAGWLGVTLMLPAMLLSISSTLAVSPFTARLFRQAKLASPGWNLAKTGIQIFIFWSILLFLLPYLLTLIESRIGMARFQFQFQQVFSALLFTCFSSLGLWSGYTMAAAGSGTPLPLDSPRQLVVCGPYAYVRNPMVIAGLGQGIAVGLWLGSFLALAYVFTGGFIWQFLVRPLEEEDMQRHFGADYPAYRQQVPCWTPRLKPYERQTAGEAGSA